MEAIPAKAVTRQLWPSDSPGKVHGVKFPAAGALGQFLSGPLWQVKGR